MNPIWLIILSGILAVAYGAVTITQVMASDPGTARMQEIAGAIAEGAQAYLRRQYLTIGVVGLVIVVGLGLELSWPVAVGFLVGAVLSEQTGERAEGRRYLGLDVLACARAAILTDPPTEPGHEPMPALTA